MIKAKLYNLEGKESGELELNEKVFGIKPKKSVVHQVFLALMANAREPWAHTKNKGEVRGGGRKPWRQKGTGRARHGSIRSPIWKGGGVTFGPRNIRNYKQKINQKMNRLAVKMCLSDKAFHNQLLVLEDLPSDSKSKTLFNLLKNLPSQGRKSLLLTEANNKPVRKAAGNIDRLVVQMAASANVAELLNNQYLIITKNGVEVLNKRLAK